ncbi:MAG: helicase-related protein [Verrucomicrobiales bacterium]
MRVNQKESAILNPAQQLVVDHAVLDSGFSCVLQLATGAGKTWLAREAMRASVSKGNRCVFLCPLRALADELAEEWQEHFDGAEVGVFTGDYGRPGRSYPVPYRDARVLIMTPERLDSCTRSWRSHWSWIPEVDWLVVDEVHLLADGHRGARLEGAISRFRRLNPLCRILALSATLGNREELADWLEGVEISSEWRPVPLTWHTVRYRKAEDKPALLLEQVAASIDDTRQTIVFVQSRRRAETLAAFLIENGINASHHHAGLDHKQRKHVEDGFRQRQTKVIVATGTLEMGLNLPAARVILYDLQGFDGVGFSPLPVNTVWQRAGRAGRPGLDSAGAVVLFTPTWDKTSNHFERGKFEPVMSRLTHLPALAEQILAEVHAGTARTLPQLQRAFDGSLAAFQKQSLDIPTLVSNMLEAGMLRRLDDNPDKLAPTPLGRIACRHQLQPDSVLSLSRFIHDFSEFTHFDLLVVLAATIDCEPVLAVDFEELDTLAEELARQPSRLFENVSYALSVLPVAGKRLLSAFKASIVLLRWIDLGDLDMVAEEDGCYPFEISRLIDSMDRLLIAGASIRRLMDQPIADDQSDDSEPGEPEPIEKSPALVRIELLRQMLLTGLEQRSASLTLIGGIGTVWAKKLVEHGITDIERLAQCPLHQLSSISGLSEKRAESWITGAEEAATRMPDEVRAPRVRTLPVDAGIAVDPYRFRRALELTVESAGRNVWHVSGGLEPHIVSQTDQQSDQQLICNCADHAKGHTCKHILAVRLAKGEPRLADLAAQLQSTSACAGDHLDLFQLWFQK